MKHVRIIVLAVVVLALTSCRVNYTNGAKAYYQQSRHNFYDVYCEPNTWLELMPGTKCEPYSKEDCKILKTCGVSTDDRLMGFHIVKRKPLDLSKFHSMPAYDTTVFKQSVLTDTARIYYKVIKKRKRQIYYFTYYTKAGQTAYISTMDMHPTKDCRRNSSDEFGYAHPNYIYFTAQNLFYIYKKMQRNVLDNATEKPELKDGVTDNFISNYINIRQVYLNDTIQTFPMPTSGQENIIIQKCDSAIDVSTYWALDPFSQFEMIGNVYGDAPTYYENTTYSKRSGELTMEYVVKRNDGWYIIKKTWQGVKDEYDYITLWPEIRTLLLTAKTFAAEAYE